MLSDLSGCIHARSPFRKKIVETHAAVDTCFQFVVGVVEFIRIYFRACGMVRGMGLLEDCFTSDFATTTHLGIKTEISAIYRLNAMDLQLIVLYILIPSF